MSVNHGLLLFDFAEPPVNGWKENLGGRGVYEKWEKGQRFLMIEFNDDGEINEWEAWTGNDESGDFDTISWGTFKECKQAVTEYMREN